MQRPGRLSELAEAPLGRLILSYSWPALVSMTLNALYATVDRFWIGHGCGEDAMAALTLAFPFMMIFGAFGVWIGVGHGSLLSIRLGEGNRVAAEKTLGQLVAMKLLFFFVLTPAVFAFLDPMLRWCGGDGVTPAALEQAKTYLRIVLFSHLFSHLAFGLSAAMRAEGSAVESMMCMVAGFGTNLVLDPVFIFGLGMGVAGAAWATDVAMLVSCVWALSFYLRGKSAVRLRLLRIRIHGALLARAMGIGLAPFLQQLMGAAINFAMPIAFSKWAADAPAATRQIASLGIFQVVMMLFLMPVFGVQQGIAPVMGYNWGAKNLGRVRRALVLGLWWTTALVSFACLAQTLFPRPIVRLFASDADSALVDLAAHDLAVANCMLWTIGLNIVCTTYFQAIGRPRMAILLSMLRQGACLLPCIAFLPYAFEDRALAVWLSLPLSDVLACLATIAPFAAHLRFLRRAGAQHGKEPAP